MFDQSNLRRKNFCLKFAVQSTTVGSHGSKTEEAASITLAVGRQKERTLVFSWLSPFYAVYRTSSSRKTPWTLRVFLPMSVSHRHAQWFVSMVISNSMRSEIEINHHSLSPLSNWYPNTSLWRHNYNPTWLLRAFRMGLGKPLKIKIKRI